MMAGWGEGFRMLGNDKTIRIFEVRGVEPFFCQLEGVGTLQKLTFRNE